jgi:type III restriction enzyme
MEKRANDVSKQYDDELEEAKKDNDNIPNDLKDMQKYYQLNKVFKEQAEGIVLPMFVKKITASNIFDENEESDVPVTKKMLAEGFELSKADRNISFASPTAQAQMIDLSKTDDYTPKAFNLKEADLKEFRKYFNSLPKEGKRRQLAANLARAMHYDEIPEKDIKDFIFNVIKDFDGEQLSELNDNILGTQGRIKEHINALLVEYQEKRFKNLLDLSVITCEPIYSFPNRLTYKKPAVGLSKGLYEEEDGDINNFEYDVIKEVSNLDNVVFWHRNPDRANGFGINGFINHYPDFIVLLKSGRIVLLETKGGDRDNSDSRRKLELGTLWANRAGDKYRYYMVFSTPKLDGAITILQLLEKLKNL